MDFVDLAPNVTIIEEADRKFDGFYEIGSNQTQVFPFVIGVDDQLKTSIQHLLFRQSLSIRVWVSRGEPLGNELFFRFHPGTGGVTHFFFDENITPTPIPEKQPLRRNKFSGIPYQAQDILVPLTPDTYYFNVHNMENSPSNSLDDTQNSYKLSFKTII